MLEASSALYGNPAHTFIYLRSLRFILGVVIMVFFQCMVALLNPVYRRGEGIKWWLVSHIVAMFSFVTVHTTINLLILSNSFIDNCKDIPLTTISFSGPLHYQWDIRDTALGLILNIMFNLNNWLADALLVSSLFDATPTCPGV